MSRLLLGIVLSLLIFLFSAPAETAGPRIDPRVISDLSSPDGSDYIIIMRDQANLSAGAHLPSEQRAASSVSTLRQVQASSQSGILSILSGGGVNYHSYWIANIIVVHGDKGALSALIGRSDIAAIESDRRFRVPLEEGTMAARTATAVEWNVQKIQAPSLWSSGVTGTGTVYGDADTGVIWDHPAIKRQYRGWDGSTANHDYNWWDAIHEDLSGNGTNPCNPGGFTALPSSGSTIPCDDAGHGTETTGVGVGDDGVGNQIGVAPGAKWIGCRNMEQNFGRPSTYIECLQFFVAPTDLHGNNPDSSKHADVINNSYGCPPDEGCSASSLHMAVENVRAAGIFMSVSAGNSGPNCGTVNDPPALEASATTVGASDVNDNIIIFSSRGPVTVDSSNRPKPDLVAPGSGIRSSSLTGYQTSAGTSFSAPHVAGTVLLLWSAFPVLRGNLSATEWVLHSSAVHLTSSQGCGGDLPGSLPNNDYGYGRVDALGAFNFWKAFTAPFKLYFPIISK